MATKAMRLGVLKSWAVSLVALGGLWCALGTPSAQAIPLFSLSQDGCTGGCGSGSTVFGTVGVVQGDANHVIVTVTLNSPNQFVKTGAGEALEFNLDGDPAITITGLTGGFSVGPAPATASTFGTFDYSIHCSGCAHGASSPLPGPISFTVEKTALGALSPTDFIANAGGFFFASDIVGPSGKTGNVAALGFTAVPATSTAVPATSVVPEPASLLLLGSGMLGLGAWGRRRLSKRA